LNLGVDYTKTALPSSNLSFSRYLFYKKYLPIKNRFGMYLLGEAGITWYQDKVDSYDNLGNKISTVYNGLTYGLALKPGFFYQVSPGILLSVDAGLLSYSYSNEGSGNWTSNLQFGLMNNFAFGVDFVLGSSAKN
jgi:hypothetical protein